MADETTEQLGGVLRFGAALRRARAARGLSLDQLAEVLGGDVTPQYLALIESDQRDPKLGLALRLTVALDIDLLRVAWGQKGAPAARARLAAAA